MSTPSTATALLPIANPYSSYNYPHHPHHHHNLNHNHNQHNLSSSSSSSTLLPHARLPATVHPYPPPSPITVTTTGGPPPSAAAPTIATRAPDTMASRAVQETSLSRRSRRGAPDWNDFYRNGPPKEIIVIDDSPPPSAAAASSAPHPTHSSTTNGMRQAAAAAATSSRPAQTNGTSAAMNGQPRHTDKKRKIQTSDYEPAAYQPAYSTTQTPHLYGNGSPTTVSANSSTASLLGTTAGTSLGSNPSLRENGIAVVNGTKRKRVTRASQAAAAAANTVDAFASYHPPPHPPHKAKDVYVQPVRDVSRSPQPYGGATIEAARRGWNQRRLSSTFGGGLSGLLACQEFKADHVLRHRVITTHRREWTMRMGTTS